MGLLTKPNGNCALFFTPFLFLLFFSDLFIHEIVTKACYVFGMVLSAENSAVNKTDKNPSPHEAYVLMGWGVTGQSINYVAYWEITCYVGKENQEE